MQLRIVFLMILMGLQFLASKNALAQGRCEPERVVELGVIGKSNIPIYGRGFGPGRRWMVGLYDRVEGFQGNLRLDVGGRVWGGAIYDNADALEGGFGLHYQYKQKVRVGIVNWNLFSLNNHPVVDPVARRKTSNINYTGLQFGRDMRLKGGCLTVNVSRILRGSHPVWHPTAVTVPYTSLIYQAEYRRVVKRDWRTNPRISAYRATSLRGRIEIIPQVERAIELWDHKLWVFLEPTFNVNVGVPKSAQRIPDTRGLVVGLRLPIR